MQLLWWDIWYWFCIHLYIFSIISSIIFVKAVSVFISYLYVALPYSLSLPFWEGRGAKRVSVTCLVVSPALWDPTQLIFFLFCTTGKTIKDHSSLLTVGMSIKTRTRWKKFTSTILLSVEMFIPEIIAHIWADVYSCLVSLSSIHWCKLCLTLVRLRSDISLAQRWD